jgi:outer membrane protein
MPLSDLRFSLRFASLRFAALALFALAVGALTASPALAQDEPATLAQQGQQELAQQVQEITFDQAVRIALEDNLNLKRAANNVDLSAINLSRQRGNFMPNLQLSSSLGQSYGRTFDQTQGTIVDQKSNSLGLQASTGVTVFNGFANQATYREASLTLEASDMDYDRQRQSVVFTVMSQYLNLLENKQQISIREENLESQSQLLTQIEEFVNVGSRPISDLYQQQAASANAELNLLQAQRLYQLSEANLIETLQLDPFGAYEFVAPEIGDDDLIEEDYSIQEMLRTAYSSRIDLKAREQDIQASEESIRAARASFWPSISLSAGYGSRYTDVGQASFSDQFYNQNRGGNVGFNIGLPIFDRFRTRDAVQQARVQYENAHYDLENLQQNIALNVRQSYLDYLSAEKALDVSGIQVTAAEQALTAEQERYNVGAATLVELSQARATYVEAISSQTSARFDFLFQKKLIDYFIGELDPSETLFR